MLRNPAQNLPRLGCISDKCGTIARTTWLDFCGNRVSGHFATNVNDLFDGVAVAIAEIERTIDPRFQCQYVRLGQILDVDVVAHAGAVARFIIIAEDEDFFAFSLRHLQDKRDQVTFRVVCLAILFGSAAGVEIAKEYTFNAMDYLSPLEDSFAEELGLAVN
jgi:hypothetical protein